MPRCFWVAGIGQGKGARPCVVLYEGDGWLLVATGTSQPHPERGRLISVPAQSRAGKALGLKVNTFFVHHAPDPPTTSRARACSSASAS
ncbi:MAG: hypothetical protein R3F43_20210 [bacterium]